MRTDRPASRFPRLSPLAAGVALALSTLDATAATYTVKSTGDNGPNTLRQAMLDANSACGTDSSPLIDFKVPGTGPLTISVATPLPALVCGSGLFSPTIDASTQNGAAPNTSGTGFNATLGIVLDGSALTSGCGLQYSPTFYGGALTVRGLEIRNFAYGAGLCGDVNAYGNAIHGNGNGISVSNSAAIGSSIAADRNAIYGNAGYGVQVAYGGQISVTNNLVGTADGISAAGNGTGIDAGGGNNTISGNVVSGNSYGGIFLSGDLGSDVVGNTIGLAADGASPMPNGGPGIELSNGSFTHVVGNVIGANSGPGVTSYANFQATLSDNRIGTAAGGTTSRPNALGVQLACASGVQVLNNTISGNAGDGLQLVGIANTSVSGNRIGVASGGASALPNGGHGIVVMGADCFPTTGPTSFDVNVIAYNGGDGVLLSYGTNQRLSQDVIFQNTIKNIDINATSGPLPNDSGDGDAGPNLQQNYPVIDALTQSGGDTIVNFTLDSYADPISPATYHIEFFENSSATAAQGKPAGESYVGSTDVTLSVSGPASFTYTLTGLHDRISATATDLSGNTSEFSPIVALPGAPAISVSPAALDFGSVPVGSSSASSTVTITSTGTAPFFLTGVGSACALPASAPAKAAMACASGAFMCSTTCAPGSYAPGTSCDVTAAFAPIAAGSASTAIYVCSGTSSTPAATINLTGFGTTPALLIDPAQYDFGSVLYGRRSAAKTFVVSNPHDTPAQIGTPRATGYFRVESTTCGATIDPFRGCQVDVTFAPTGLGVLTGSLEVPGATPTATGASALLSGTGVLEAQLALPSAIDLGSYTLGKPPLVTALRLENTGNTALGISTISASAPFSVTSDCPRDLGPAESCTLNIAFSVTEKGDYTGTLTIVSSAASGSRAIALTARAQPLPVPVLRVDPVTMGFGERMIGTVSATQRVTIRNEGGAEGTLAIATSGAEFSISGSTCGPRLAPDASCVADIAFRPLGLGTRFGTLSVTGNDEGSPHDVGLVGTGCRPFVPSRNRTGTGSGC